MQVRLSANRGLCIFVLCRVFVSAVVCRKNRTCLYMYVTSGVRLSQLPRALIKIYFSRPLYGALYNCHNINELPENNLYLFISGMRGTLL